VRAMTLTSSAGKVSDFENFNLSVNCNSIAGTDH